MNKKKYMECIYCGRKIYENEIGIRRKGFAHFYCSYRCLVKDHGLSETTTVCDEVLNEDNLTWDGVE